MNEKNHKYDAASDNQADRASSDVSYTEDVLGPRETNVAKETVDLEHGQAGAKDAGQVQWTFTRCIAIAALCGSYVGSQVTLYFTGGALSYIAISLDTKYPQWIPNANLLAIASTLPFVGYFTDLVGRRSAVIIGAALLVLGSILVSTAQHFIAAIFGMIFAGIGAGICEMTAYAGVAEMTPVKFRGLTIALVTVSILPFCPYVLYTELVEQASTWRWAIAIAGFWNFISFIGLIFCYHPPPRHAEWSRKDILQRIDYVGAFLSVAGLSLFLAGLQAGGYEFPWVSPQVLAPLLIGVAVIAAFVVYEKYFAKFPMVPGDIFKGQRIMSLSFVIAFVAGMNFYSILNFFPILLTNYYAPDPTLVGIRAMGYGFSILAGACVINALLSYTHGHVREMITFCCVLMTALTGALAAATPFNPAFAVGMSTVGGFGIGGVLIPATTLAIIASPDEYIATSTALALSIRFVGGAVGNTIYFNIYQNKLKTELSALVAEYAVKAGLPQSSAMQFATVYTKASASGAIKPSMFSGIKGFTAAALNGGMLGARYAYADSLRLVWYTSVAFGIIACVCCALLPNIKSYLTRRVAVDIH